MDKNKKYIVIAVGVLVVIILGIRIKNVSKEAMYYTPIASKVVVLDAGHGGIDPGATNKDKTILEKDINLAIVKQLQSYIEASSGVVVLTRSEDVSLYEDTGNKTTRQKYNENLRNRKKIVDESNADILVSIHLNAFGDSKYYGAQSFYPNGDEESKKLADFIQKELKNLVDNENNRKIKPRDDIYLLKNNKIPSVLIECGFLSNETEANLLNTAEYQNKLAWAIYVGIQKYFS